MRALTRMLAISASRVGPREQLSEMPRHQSAQNARRFSPRRRPAERNRCPSCRHARGRGEPLLWPEVVGAARSSRHPEKPCLRCEGVSRLRPGSILQSRHLSVHPTCHGCRRGSRKSVSHGAIPSGTLPFSHCEFLTSAGRWRHMTATSTVQRPALLATPPSRSVPCLCPRTTRRMLDP